MAYYLCFICHSYLWLLLLCGLAWSHLHKALYIYRLWNWCRTSNSRWYSRYMHTSERELTFQNKVLNFLFSEAISLKFFLLAIQGWVGGIIHKTVAMSFISTYSLTYCYLHKNNLSLCIVYVLHHIFISCINLAYYVLATTLFTYLANQKIYSTKCKILTIPCYWV